MTKNNYSNLPWKFEAFRKYITFEVLQQAAACLLKYDGRPLFTDTALMNEFTSHLVSRTGLPWLPERDTSTGVNFNLEGTVFRNKARIFSSFYIFDHSSLIERDELRVTNFGKALGQGYINRREFYNEIILRFEYPHPAYEEDWVLWDDAKVNLKPFIFILEILAAIYLEDGVGEVTVAELAEFAHPSPFQALAPKIASQILSSRKTKVESIHKRSDAVDRKISDLLGFLCISGMTFYNGSSVRLNLLTRHLDDKTYFWDKRNSQSKYEEILKLINNVK
jgi:hypothetical protein